MTSYTTKESKVLLSKFLAVIHNDVTATDFPCSLERIVREASANRDHERIAKIVDQLCNDYAYAVHQPHSRNGGLIGLAALSIALGSVDISRPFLRCIDADPLLGGSCTILEGDRSTSFGLFHGSRCKGSVLCL